MNPTDKAYRISSNITLFFKIGFPCFWFIFFGSITLGLLISDAEGLVYMNSISKIILVTLFAFFLLVILFTFVRLKRVEMAEEHLYVSNYFQTYRYHFDDVEKIKSLDFVVFLVLIVHLKSKGKLGRKIPFIASKSRLSSYLKMDRPSIFTSILNK